MKRRLLVFMLVFAMMLTACAAPEPEETTPAPTPKPTVSVTPTPEPTPSPTPEIKDVSFTTGLPFFNEYKPVIAVIENSPAARPQTGLQTADVVYEVPVEGSITRFVCVFSDNVPEKIMPIRSARPPFLYIQNEWNAVFMHFGGSGEKEVDFNKPYSYYGHPLKKQVKIDVDGLKGKWNKIYKRISGIKAPHNVEANALAAQALYDYNPEPLHWLFGQDTAYPGETVSKISLKMCADKENYVSYEYDAKSDTYLRFMEGKKFSSKETNEQVHVKNIIVQYSTYDSVEGIKLWKLVGSGNADIYVGGKLVKGKWERKSESSKTVFYDAEGKQIVLRPGNTWIHLHPNP